MKVFFFFFFGGGGGGVGVQVLVVFESSGKRFRMRGLKLKDSCV